MKYKRNNQPTSHVNVTCLIQITLAIVCLWVLYLLLFLGNEIILNPNNGEVIIQLNNKAHKDTIPLNLITTNVISHSTIVNNIGTDTKKVSNVIIYKYNTTQRNNYSNAIGVQTKLRLDAHYMNKIGLDTIMKTFPHNNIADLIVLLQKQPQCYKIPIFVAMASVVNELYWQLVENFVYTMAHFALSDCSIMICVSDLNCMKKCKDTSFPCYLYEYENVYDLTDKSAELSGTRIVSALEQIANLKLYLLPKALEQGASLFILDLDIGFIHSPMELIDYINNYESHVDILVQYNRGSVEK